MYFAFHLIIFNLMVNKKNGNPHFFYFIFLFIYFIIVFYLFFLFIFYFVKF